MIFKNLIPALIIAIMAKISTGHPSSILNYAPHPLAYSADVPAVAPLGLHQPKVLPASPSHLIGPIVVPFVGQLTSPVVSPITAPVSVPLSPQAHHPLPALYLPHSVGVASPAVTYPNPLPNESGVLENPVAHAPIHASPQSLAVPWEPPFGAALSAGFGAAHPAYPAIEAEHVKPIVAGLLKAPISDVPALHDPTLASSPVIPAMPQPELPLSLFNAPTVSAAVVSTKRVGFGEFINPHEKPANEPTNVIIDSPVNPVNLVYRSLSSPINVENLHQGISGSFKQTASVDEPHHHVHTVTKPVIQELHEVIAPVRKVKQEVLPVQEEVKTVIPKMKSLNPPLASLPKPEPGGWVPVNPVGQVLPEALSPVPLQVHHEPLAPHPVSIHEPQLNFAKIPSAAILPPALIPSPDATMIRRSVLPPSVHGFPQQNRIAGLPAMAQYVEHKRKAAA